MEREKNPQIISAQHMLFKTWKDNIYLIQKMYWYIRVHTDGRETL